MAKQDITNREKGGKQEKLPQEGYNRQPMSNREKARMSENDVAINKMIAFFYSGFLNFAEYKCGDYSLNKDPEMLLKEVLAEAESYDAFNRLRSTVDEYRNLVASLLCSKVKKTASDQMEQGKDIPETMKGTHSSPRQEEKELREKSPTKELLEAYLAGSQDASIMYMDLLKSFMSDWGESLSIRMRI